VSQQLPRKKWGRRDYVGGLAALLFVFGIVTYLLGSARPWGVQQFVGLAAAVLGLVLMAVRLRLPRSSD
jgi:hypothetical protein